MKQWRLFNAYKRRHFDVMTPPPAPRWTPEEWAAFNEWEQGFARMADGTDASEIWFGNHPCPPAPD